MSRIQDSLKRIEHEQDASEHTGIALHGPEVGFIGPIAVESAAEDFASQAAAASVPLGDSLASEESLERCFQASWSPDRKSILFGDGQDGRGAEEFRALRAKLYQGREKKRLKKILITSSMPKEGRSFVAANLAHVLALQPACRVLLIDADLRNPGLHDVLGTSATPGLAEYLLGGVEEFVVMQRGQMENLFFVPSGLAVANPTEAVSNGRVRSLLDGVESLFDWIVIDSPAAIPFSDAGHLATYCDGVLMVVRSNATAFDIARKALRRFRQEDILGVLLNGAKTES